MRFDFDEFAGRATRTARGIGLVFVTFFIPTVLRDGLGMRWPEAGVGHGLTTGAPWLALGAVLAALVVATVVLWLYGKMIADAGEPRHLLPFDSRGRRDFWFGLGGGIAAAAVAILPMVFAGQFRIEGLAAPGPGQTALAGLGVALLILAQSALEEVGFRGPAFRELTRGINAPIGAAFLAGTFCLAHSANPDMTGRAVAGVFLAGFALAGLVRWRGDLWMAVGAHAGWNLGVGMLWSSPVSGFRFTPRLLDVRLGDSAAWTGGGFGVEASLPGITVFALVAALAWSAGRRRSSR